MTNWVSSCILVMATVLIGLGAGLSASTPMERAFEDVRNQAKAGVSPKLHRSVRSATGGVPCVTVQFLTNMKERFVRWLDHNNDGQSTFEEVKNYLRRFKPNVSDEAVAAFIARRDLDRNGAIDFVPEYVHDLSAPDSTLESATEWFQLQDTNDDGIVSEQELMKVAESIGMSPQEALDMVEGFYMQADANKDGKLSFDEYKTLYNQ